MPVPDALRWLEKWHSLAREYVDEIGSWRKAEEWELNYDYFAEQSQQDEKNLQQFRLLTSLLHQKIQADYPHLDAKPIYQVYRVITDWFEFQEPDKLTSQRSLNARFEKAEFTLEALHKIELMKLSKSKRRIGKDAKPRKVVGPNRNEVCRHNKDFTMVKWFGVEYSFALGVQSSVVKALWEEWEKTGLGLSQQTIRDLIDAERDNFRMANAFRKSPAMGTMIQSDGKGMYRLAKPQVTKVKTNNQRRINGDTR